MEALRAISLDIKQFIKTPEGMALIETQKPFILGGVIFQGFQGALATVAEKQLTHQEVSVIYDVDKTRDRIINMRSQRLGSRHDRKSGEYRKRRAELRGEQDVIEGRMERRQRLNLPDSRADIQDLKDIDARMDRLTVTADEHATIAGDVKAPPDGQENLYAQLARYQEILPGFNAEDFPTPQEALDYAKKRTSGAPAVADEPSAPTEGVGEPLRDVLERVEAAAIVKEATGVDVGTGPTKELLEGAKAALHICTRCGAVPPVDHAKPKMWLIGHTAGKHRTSVGK